MSWGLFECINSVYDKVSFVFGYGNGVWGMSHYALGCFFRGYPPVHTRFPFARFSFKNGDDGDEKDGLTGSDVHVIAMYAFEM